MNAAPLSTRLAASPLSKDELALLRATIYHLAERVEVVYSALENREPGHPAASHIVAVRKDLEGAMTQLKMARECSISETAGEA